MGAKVGHAACWAAISGLSTLLYPALAAGDVFQVGGAGAFLGYSFGENGGFEWGVEGFATHHFEDYPGCGDRSRRYGVGPTLRLSAVRLSRLEVTLAAHGGGELARSYFAIDGELGASLFLGKERAWVAPHSGVLFEPTIFNVYFRHEWLGPSLSVGGGARFLPTFGVPGFCEAGRPFRGGAGEAQRAAVRVGSRVGARAPRARLWARRAAEECAAVAAFLQLARELVELEAPASLVNRALRAAGEEYGHTLSAAKLASRWGGDPIRVLPPAAAVRPRLPPAQALRRLVHESWLDGCVNEGFAAALARAEAQLTRDAEEAAVCARIAREETSHAELAFAVLAWAQERAPELLRELGPARNFGGAATSWLPRSVIDDLARTSGGSAELKLRRLSA